MSPVKLIDILERFKDSKDQQREIIGSVLQAMRQDKYDIRLFNFQQLVKFIEFVGES